MEPEGLSQERNNMLEISENEVREIDYDNGRIEWRRLRDDALHREDGPAVICHLRGKFWYLNNQLHREDGPASIEHDGTQKWYQRGICHREDGPAVIHGENNDKIKEEWHYKGKLHREDGPAEIWRNGTLLYYKNGHLHRQDGPAVILSEAEKPNQVLFSQRQYQWWWEGKGFYHFEDWVEYSRISYNEQVMLKLQYYSVINKKSS